MRTIRYWLYGALACAHCLASAESTGLTLYGLLDTGVEVAKAGGGTVVRLQSGQYAGSRWGLRGTEDLGGGTRALFVLENGFNSDTGLFGQNSRLFGRQAFVGIRNGWGTFTMGRQYTPMVSVAYQMDAFENGMAPMFPNLGVYPGAERVDNALKYTTPNFGPVSLSALIALGERATAPRAGDDGYGLNIHYQAGSTRLAAAWNQRRFASADMLGAVLRPVQMLPATSVDGRITTFIVGGNHDFGAFKLFGGLQRQRFAGLPGVAPMRQNLATISLSVPVASQGRLLAGYARLDDRSPLQRDARLLGLGYVHSLSRRTSLYGAMAWLTNRNGAANVLGGNTSPGLPLEYAGADPRALQFGLRHAF